MKSFDHAIGLGMVGGGHDDLNPPSLGQLLKERGRKLGASVGCNYRRNSIVLNPSGHETVDDRLGGDVRQRNCRWPSSEAIHCCEEVAIPV